MRNQALEIRPAAPDEAGLLTDLAMRSKGHWGYSQDFLDACREELTVNPDDIGASNYFVAAENDSILGFHAIQRLSDDDYELDALFVEPERIGGGIGRALIEHATEVLSRRGASKLIIQGDPNAVPFYVAAGGRQIGTRESDSIPDRQLPLFEVAVKAFRWPVSAQRAIAAPASEIWDAISERGNLERCHPFCASNPVHTWPGSNSRDDIHYLSGWSYERRFCEWIDGVGYDLEIGRNGGGQSSVSWRITPIDDRSCALRITVRPYVLQGTPLAIRWIPHLLRLRPILRSYLDSVVRGIDWYVVRHEPVPRNAFGAHPWFSAR